MSTRLITLLLGALIALPSYAQDLRSIALQIIKSQPIEQSGSPGLTTVFRNKKTLQLREKVGKEGKEAFEEVPYMTFCSPIAVDDYDLSMEESPYIDKEIRPYVEQINRSKTLKKGLLLTASEQAEYLPGITFFYEGDKLAKAAHRSNAGVVEYYFRDHSLLFIYNKPQTEEHRIYLYEGRIVRYLDTTPWGEEAIEALYNELTDPLIPKL